MANLLPLPLPLLLPALLMLMVSPSRLVVAISSVKPIGSYSIDVKEVGSCEEQGTAEMMFDIYRRRDDSDMLFEGHLFFKYPFGTGLTAETEVLRQGSMGWSNVYSYTNDDICHSIQSFSPEFWKSLMKAAGIPDECPVQPGNYTVNEWKPLLDLDKMPSLPYGTYRLIIQLKQGTGELVGCYQILVEVSEKVDA
ncbi:uncharacterized protein LOC126481389 [Schistocerca serialis cubense]|uniref:uncharacterized protein LOC126481389 n=1 Tax=Schistocerca serialis cubense TaxID=2023355 RepID=UPI00214E7D2A|nr:uncharacterized protein LOC126481389 [Schistocerca serialis cubense]